MGRDTEHARSWLRLPGWTVVAGMALVVMVALPVYNRSGQDEAAVADTTSVRPGDPAPYDGWGKVDFPHDFHIDDLELDCGDCHHETNAARLVMPHDDYFDDFWIDCTICHKTDGDVSLDPQACGDCHPATPRDSADETLSAKVVIHQNCWECHDSGTGAEAAENCSNCHDGPSMAN